MAARLRTAIRGTVAGFIALWGVLLLVGATKSHWLPVQFWEGVVILALSPPYWRRNRWAYFAVPIVALYQANVFLHVFVLLYGTDDWTSKGEVLGWVFVWLAIAVGSAIQAVRWRRTRSEATASGVTAPNGA